MIARGPEVEDRARNPLWGSEPNPRLGLHLAARLYARPRDVLKRAIRRQHRFPRAAESCVLRAGVWLSSEQQPHRHGQLAWFFAVPPLAAQPGGDTSPA